MFLFLVSVTPDAQPLFLCLGAFSFGWDYEDLADGTKFPKHFFAR
jgi:hypothetical protein